MSFLQGGLADWTGAKTGSLVVERLVGRDRSGPRWELSCTAKRCNSRHQILSHARLTAALQSGASLPCSNPQCPSKQNYSETLAELRRRERLDQANREAANAEGRTEKAAQTAKLRAREAQ